MIRLSKLRLLAAVAILTAVAGTALSQRYLNGTTWPEPDVVTPGVNNAAPSDAIVLFDGKNFDMWDGVKPDQKINDDGSFTARSVMKTKQAFGDCQLHVEWAAPLETKGKTGQGRGNNGIGLMNGTYEIQVLDNFDNPTYPEGMAGSVYNQKPPMVNACRKPGEWQTYDIVFTPPVFDGDKVAKPGHVTVLQNGVLVQNHSEILGSTFFNAPTKYVKHAEKLPLVLLYHGDPVMFRNIWIREIKESVGMPGERGIEGKKKAEPKKKDEPKKEEEKK